MTSDGFVDENMAEVRGSARVPVANDMEHDKVQVDENSRETKINHDVVIKLSRETLGRGNRQLKAFVLLKYFVTDSARCSYDLACSFVDSQTRSSGISLYHITYYVTCDKFLARHGAFVAHIDAGIQPARSLK